MVDVIMYYYGIYGYFSITIRDYMNIMYYLDYAGHVLIVMFDVVVLCSLDD